MRGIPPRPEAYRAVNRFDPEGEGYDEVTANALIRRFPLNMAAPMQYEGDTLGDGNSFQAWVWHEDSQEYKVHGSSLDPQTGMVLKGRRHPTWDLMEQEELRRGNVIEKIGGRYYSGTPYELSVKRRILEGGD